MKPDGGCEFVTAFAKHMPIQIFLTMMDLPLNDAARLVPIVERQIRDPSMEAMNESFAEMLGYLDEKVTERERNPGDDIISSLLAGKLNNAPVPHADILSICMTLMFAGLDTVVSAQSFFMRFLATHPEHRRQLVENPALIGNAVEELCRYHGVTNLARSAAKDLVYKGVTMKAGEQILLPTVLFGLDERRFSDPLTIDFTRRDVTHLIFGGGVHRCLGSHLARMELRVMLEEWLPRIPYFSVDEDIGSEAKSGKVNAMKRLPLRWRN
jgi:cytochrome P450